MQDDYYLCGNGEWVEYDPTPKTWHDNMADASYYVARYSYGTGTVTSCTKSGSKYLITVENMTYTYSDISSYATVVGDGGVGTYITVESFVYVASIIFSNASKYDGCQYQVYGDTHTTPLDNGDSRAGTLPDRDPLTGTLSVSSSGNVLIAVNFLFNGATYTPKTNQTYEVSTEYAVGDTYTSSGTTPVGARVYLRIKY